MIDMGFASHYWIMFVIFGAAVLIITTLYFFLAWLPAYKDKAEKGKKGNKIVIRILTPIIGGLALIGMIGAPALAAN